MQSKHLFPSKYICKIINLVISIMNIKNSETIWSQKKYKIPDMIYELCLLVQPHFPSPVRKHPLVQLLQTTS